MSDVSPGGRGPCDPERAALRALLYLVMLAAGAAFLGVLFQDLHSESVPAALRLEADRLGSLLCFAVSLAGLACSARPRA